MLLVTKKAGSVTVSTPTLMSTLLLPNHTALLYIGDCFAECLCHPETDHDDGKSTAAEGGDSELFAEGEVLFGGNYSHVIPASLYRLALQLLQELLGGCNTRWVVALQQF